jgi:hypothetical protein
MLTERQVPYTGPYYGPNNTKKPKKGPTAEALKRAFSRMGYFDWQDFDPHYNRKLQIAVASWQRQIGIKPATGNYGKLSWQAIRKEIVPPGRIHSGEYALDHYARKLIQDEAGEQSGGTDEQVVQGWLIKFATLAIANEANWHYSQHRPIYVNVDPSASAIDSDCSGFIIQAYAYAKRKSSLDVPDPAKFRFTGYGNTDWYEDDHPKIAPPFNVGDLAHFSSSRHVIMCIKPGGIDKAEWVSHGREAGPERIKLSTYHRFPGEYMFTVRPPLIKE